MNVEGDLIARGVAAIAGYLDVAFLAYSREGTRRPAFPELDLHDVGFQVVQHQVAVDDGLQLFKQRITLFGVVGADLALLLVAVDGDRGLAQDVVLLFHVGRELRTVFLKVRAQANVAGLALAVLGEVGVQVVGHVFAFQFHASNSFVWIVIWIWYRAALASALVKMPALLASIFSTS